LDVQHAGAFRDVGGSAEFLNKRQVRPMLGRPERVTVEPRPREMDHTGR
jgi:hypothetical protein